MGAPEARLPPAVSPWPRRRAANAAIVALLAVQVALPLRYYLTGGGSDERFAWRMFSSERVERCDVRLVEVPLSGTPVEVGVAELRSQLHGGWIQLLARGRPAVIDAWLERRCTAGELAEVRYERRCTGADGAPRPVARRSLRCAGGAASAVGDS